MGLVIDSPALARALGEAFDATIPRAAWEARLAAGGQALEWVERTASGEVRHAVEPGTTWFKRSGVEFLSVLPIDWLL
jgi:putative cardiolipin synthase